MTSSFIYPYTNVECTFGGRECEVILPNQLAYQNTMDYAEASDRLLIGETIAFAHVRVVDIFNRTLGGNAEQRMAAMDAAEKFDNAQQRASDAQEKKAAMEWYHFAAKAIKTMGQLRFLDGGDMIERTMQSADQILQRALRGQLRANNSAQETLKKAAEGFLHCKEDQKARHAAALFDSFIEILKN